MATSTTGTITLHQLSPDSLESDAELLVSCLKIVPSGNSSENGKHCGCFQSFLEGSAMNTLRSAHSVPFNREEWNSIVHTAAAKLKDTKEMIFTVLPDLTVNLTEEPDQQAFHQKMLEGKHYLVGRLSGGALVSKDPGHDRLSTLTPGTSLLA